MSGRKTNVLRGHELTRGLAACWNRIQSANPDLDSPYFAADYVRAVASVRGDVEVAVLESDGQATGFFPFQRSSRGVGLPVGGRLSDFQAVIALPGSEWSAPELIRSCRLTAWKFDHLLVSQGQFRPYHWAEAPSPFVDLADGFDAYRQARRHQGSRGIDSILYERRKAERRVGPVRFEFHTNDERVFQALLQWKGAQLRSSGQTDLFSSRWIVELLDRIRQCQGQDFSGVLSALYLGERLAAAHLGMRSGAVLHYWFPAYDPAQATSSAGQICFVELARAAANLGVRRIDLGKGREPYKLRLMSGSIAVAEGALDLRPAVALATRSWHRALDWARDSPLRRPLLRPARWLRRMIESGSTFRSAPR
jgi:CelD/BcsL family acetyltransferase involved in cellulose biosynthesis